MSLSGKLEFVHEVRSPGKFFLEVYGSKKEYLPKICPDKIPVVELLEGNWGNLGSSVCVHYLTNGKILTVRETFEAVDKDNVLITFNVFEGDLMKLYKSLKMTVQITSEAGKNFINWSFEYEKQNANAPAPEFMRDFAREVNNTVDAYYVENKGELKHKESNSYLYQLEEVLDCPMSQCPSK